MVKHDVSSIAVYVETVDVATVQGGCMDVVVAEDAPFCFSTQADEAASSYIVHVDGVAVLVVVGIGAADGDAADGDVYGVSDLEALVAADGRIGTRGRGREHGDVRDAYVVLQADVEQVGDRGTGLVAHECQVAEGLGDGVGLQVFALRHTYDSANIGKIEFLYNQAAQACGIVVPEFRLIQGKYFAEKRFDLENGQRLHVATAAGLLNETIFPPKMDYHTLLQLTGFLTQDPVQVEEQFRRMCFNVYAENMDDHARNFSFICRNGSWTLSPAYDLTNDHTLGEHATTANGKGLPSDEDLITVGTAIRITRQRCLEIIKQVKPIAQDLLHQV